MDLVLFFWIGLKEFSRHWCCFCFIKWCYFETYSQFKYFTPIFRLNMKFCIRARNLVIHRCEIGKSVWWFNIDRCSKYLSWTDAYLDHKRIIMRMSRCDILLWWICHLPYLDMLITEQIFWHIKHLAIWLEKINFISKGRCLLIPRCTLWTNRSNRFLRPVWPDSMTGLTACGTGLTNFSCGKH